MSTRKTTRLKYGLDEVEAQSTKKKARKKVTSKKTLTPVESKFNSRDKILVTYRTKWFDIVNVPGIILRANRTSGYPFKVKLEDADGKPINLGHNDDGGEPGSGPFVYCKDEHLKMVDKFVPQRLTGKIKENWKVGESFIPKADFGIDQDDHDDRTGVTPEMVELAKDKVLTIAGVINRCGVDWLLDGNDNFMWLAAWIDPVEA